MVFSMITSSPPTRTLRAFTLIELLTVIAIIGILAAILIPVVGKVRDSARLTQTTSNMRQVGASIALYTLDNGDFLPARNTTNSGNPGGLQPSVHTWFRILAPTHSGSGSWDDPGSRLGAHIAPYGDVTGPIGSERPLEILRDPLWQNAAAANGANTDQYWMAPPFVLNPILRRNHHQGLPGDISPFGKDGAAAALRGSVSYTQLMNMLDSPSRVWAMIQCDRGLIADSQGDLTNGMVHALAPAQPVGGSSRIALMFDWSVQRVPVGTDLRKPL